MFSNLAFYHFTSTWHIESSCDEVFSALYEVKNYPRWWPEIKEGIDIGDGEGMLRARSFLPYDLRFTLHRSSVDQAAGILEASVSGDMEGTICWKVTQEGGKTKVFYEQKVMLHKNLLNILAPIVRPLFIWNHTLMMRHGERGLSEYLGG